MKNNKKLLNGLGASVGYCGTCNKNYYSIWPISQLIQDFLTILLLLLCFNIQLFAKDLLEPQNYGTYSAPSDNAGEVISTLMSGSLLNIGGSKLTPTPGEEIDLYTGTLKLKNVDFSTPIAPGLNLEVTRVYESSIYNYYNFSTSTTLNYSLPNWNIATSYIAERHPDVCQLSNEECDLIWIHADASAELLRRENINSMHWESKEGSVLEGNERKLVDKRGYKYYFNIPMDVNGGWRLYIGKIETPDGKHWIQYHYSGKFMTNITTSDSEKSLTFNYTYIDYKFSTRNGTEGRGSILELTSVDFNGQEVVRYNYHFYTNHDTRGWTALTSVAKKNGETISYEYDFRSLLPGNNHNYPGLWRLMLTNVNYPNGEKHDYVYTEDLERYAKIGLRDIRIGQVTHNTNKKFNGQESTNSWVITQNYNEFYDGTPSKSVVVTGPYHSTKTIFSHKGNEIMWRLGLPFEHVIYKNTTVSDSNIAQKEIYDWQNKLFSNKLYYLGSSNPSNEPHDTVTHKPLLRSKTTTRYNDKGQDVYKYEQSDFDAHDNPQKIVLTSSDGKIREINQTFYNNTDKNIFGLRTNLAIGPNNLINQSYDEYGNLLAETKQGITTRYTYIDGLPHTKTDNMGNITYYKNYAGTTPELVENPDGTKVQSVVNKNGTIASSTDAKGYTTSYEYNSNQQLIEEISPNPHRASTKYTYDNLNFSKTTSVGNYSLFEEYNHAGLLRSKLENNNIKRTIDYDGLGRKIFESVPYSLTGGGGDPNHGHYYQYDSLNRVTSDCFPKAGNNCVVHQYFANNVVKTIAPNEEYTLATYQAFGDPDNGKLMEIKQEHTTTKIGRDILGAATSVTQGKISKNYEYDANHNLVKYTEPESGITEYKYDDIGNIEEIIQNTNRKIKFRYNKQNHKLENITYDAVTGLENFSYDKNGNLIKTSKGNISKIYEYDETNQLTTESITLQNVKDADQKPVTLTTLYDYTSKGDLQSITYPDQSRLELMPDEFGRPSRLGNYVNNIEYHPNGGWKAYSFANGVNASTGLDSLYRINSYKYGSLDLNYNYDNNSNLLNLALKDTQKSSYNYNLNFGYDLEGRISEANGPWGKLEYAYDANNNMTSIKNVAKQSTFFNYDDKLHLLGYNNKHYAYDDLGNITRDNNYSYEYGLDSNLLNVNGNHSQGFEYDTDHNRIIKHNYSWKPNDIITFYTKSGQALYEYNTKYKRATKYIYLNNQRLAKIEDYVDDIKSTKPNKPKTSFYYNDAVGSPVAMADAGGKTLWRQVYEPFGATYLDKVDRKENKHGFVGKEIDNTGLSYFGARYYDDAAGRFMSIDPSAVEPEKPLTFNRYIYGNNNPYKYVDTDGRNPFMVAGLLIVEFALGAVTGYTASVAKISKDDPNYQKKVIAGTLIAGTAAVVTASVSTGIAVVSAVRNYSLAVRAAYNFASDVGINTLSGVLTDVAQDQEVDFKTALQSSAIGSIYNRKINPMMIEPHTFNTAMLFGNKSTIFTIFSDRMLGGDCSTSNQLSLNETSKFDGRYRGK